MPDDSKTISRLLATGIPRSKAADDPSTATLMKLFKVPEEQADPLPKINPVKLTPVEWVPPKVVAPEELPTDNAERYLAELAAAKAKARAKARGG